MKSWKQTSFIFVVIAVILYFFSPLNYLTLDKAFADEEKKSGSTIGGVSVDGLDEEEIRTALQTAIQTWTSEQIVIAGGGAQLSLDPSTIQFDIDATIENYKTLTSTPWFAFWETEKTVQLPVQIVQNELFKNEIATIVLWDTELTYDKVMLQASYLRSHEVEAEVLDTSFMENERLAISIEETPEDAQGVQELVDVLNNTIFTPNEPFSLLSKLDESANLANNEALNFVASVLYNTVIQTSFDIVERHSQNKVPTYLEPGIEAEVNPLENKDLQFMNNTSQPAILKASLEENSLKLEIYSSIKESEVSVQVVREETIKPRIINRYTNDLPIGQQTLVQEGEEGLRVTVYRTITKDGFAEEQRISRDYYAPTNRIVLQSSRQPEPEVTEGLQESNTVDSVPNVDLDGNGLSDFDDTDNNETSSSEETESQSEVEEELPPGSYYDKGGNLITP